MKTNVQLLIIAFFLVGLIGLAGCGSTKVTDKPEKEALPAAPAKTDTVSPQKGTATVSPKKGGTLTVALTKEITVYNPQVKTISTDRIVRELMYQSLLGLDVNMGVKPLLAQRWEISADGSEYTFYIQKGVKFHNGQPMTARDVKWTVDYVMDPKNGAYGRPLYEQVKSVAVLDDYTIKFTLKQPTAAFLASLATIQAAAIVPVDSLATGDSKPTAFPPGTGPFKFDEHKAGQYVALTRFSDYWEQVPYLDRIVIRPVPDDDVRFSALRAGDLDAIQSTPLQWAQQVIDGKFPELNMSTANLSGFRRVVFNVRRAPFDNVKVRQAVAYALNKQEIIDAVYWGMGYTTNDKMIGSPWDLKIPEVQRNIQKAKQLLQEAGYPNGVEVKLMLRQGTEKEAQVIANQLADAGIKVNLELLESTTYSSRQISGDFQFMAYGGGPRPDPHTTIAPDLGTEPDAGNRGSNVSGYNSPEMDRLLEQLNVETSTDKRKEIYRQVMTKFLDEAPEIYIGYIPYNWGYNKKFKDFVLAAHDSLSYVGGGLNYTWIDK